MNSETTETPIFEESRTCWLVLNENKVISVCWHQSTARRLLRKGHGARLLPAVACLYDDQWFAPATIVTPTSNDLIEQEQNQVEERQIAVRDEVLTKAAEKGLSSVEVSILRGDYTKIEEYESQKNAPPPRPEPAEQNPGQDEPDPAIAIEEQQNNPPTKPK